MSLCTFGNDDNDYVHHMWINKWFYRNEFSIDVSMLCTEKKHTFLDACNVVCAIRIVLIRFCIAFALLKNFVFTWLTRTLNSNIANRQKKILLFFLVSLLLSIICWVLLALFVRRNSSSICSLFNIWIFHSYWLSTFYLSAESEFVLYAQFLIVFFSLYYCKFHKC